MMDRPVAHNLDVIQRTEDVRMKRVSPFSKMLLKDAVRKGLHQAGFVYPTVIQATAIPVGKSGLDLLVQAKSGTGKTLIFCTILLEAYRADRPEPQSLIVVPTREIAVQIEGVLNQIGRFCQGFRAVCVIGGLDVTEDRKRLQGAKAVVGTPGRLLHLIQNDVLNTSRMKLLILDEADKMYTQSFRQDLQRIQRALPAKRQTIACSATFCDDLDKEVAKIMRNPLLISTEERASLLIGIKQFAYELPEQKTSILEMDAKLDAIKDIFGRIAFKQCLVFAGSQSRADSYRNYLEHQGWPCELISGAQDQKTRLEMFHKFREFKTRILIATDLMSRGIDSEHVNLVINLELPTDVVTYLHRIGRAGRFGSHGIAINFIASNKDRALFRRLISQVGNGMQVLKFPQRGQSVEELHDIWDFSDFSAECQHYGCFGSNPVAPLASQEHDSLGDSRANKENISDNKSQTNETNSSIDTKTFQIDSTGINLLYLLVDRPEHVTQAGQKLTPDSRQSSSQRLPSSNTIDDASSIAADSIRSSQQDISRYQSVLMQKAAIPTLVEFLVDQKSAENSVKCNGAAKKPQIDLFEDYKKTVEQQESESTSAVLKPNKKVDAINFKSLLIDQPQSNKESGKVTHKDIYSDYANFDGDEASSSMSLATTATQSIDKATFILSVATPSQARESLEELQNSLLDLSQVDSMTDDQSLPEVKHFPSPVHNQPIPDVVPAPALKGLPMRAATKQILTVNVGAQVEIPPQIPLVNGEGAVIVQPLVPPRSPASDGTLSSGQDDSASVSAASSNTARGGGSSGFDEEGTSSTSSGIQTSEEGENIAAANNDDDDGSFAVHARSYGETDEEDDDDDEEENYFDDEDDDDDDDDEEENYFDDDENDAEENYFGDHNVGENYFPENGADDDEEENYFDDEDDDDDEEENYFEDEDDDDEEEENYFEDEEEDNDNVAEENNDNVAAGNWATSNAVHAAIKNIFNQGATSTTQHSVYAAAKAAAENFGAAVSSSKCQKDAAIKNIFHQDATATTQHQHSVYAAAKAAAESFGSAATSSKSQNPKSSKNQQQQQQKQHKTPKHKPRNEASVSDLDYDEAYQRWIKLYWEQLSHIQQYVRYSSKMPKQQKKK